MPTTKGAAPNPKSKKGTVNPAGIIRGSGGMRVASPSAVRKGPFGAGSQGRKK
jgi:hypothetical protein